MEDNLLWSGTQVVVVGGGGVWGEREIEIEISPVSLAAWPGFGGSEFWIRTPDRACPEQLPQAQANSGLMQGSQQFGAKNQLCLPSAFCDH